MNIEPQDPHDPLSFRKVMGQLPTGVAVITSSENDQKVGLVVGTFTSISLNPPLVGFFPAKSSKTWARIEKTGRFCANVLGSDQTDLCRIFASSVDDKFGDLSHPESPLGMPILPGAVAWIECLIREVSEQGDHHLVVGTVQSMGIGSGATPLVFAKGAYHGLTSLDLC